MSCGAELREGQTFAGTSSIVRWANFVKLPHTVFALPFAVVGVIIASYRAPVTPAAVGWVLLAFTAARFSAMGFNRLVDRYIDARNPRTSGRELPAGRIDPRQARAAVAVAIVAFISAAWQLNPLCGRLAPVALAWILCYSYTKRFTAWSHLVLGLGLGIAPVGGFLAVTGAWPAPWWGLVSLAFAVMTWVAGFDVLYSLQDLEFDRRERLHSIPARHGPGTAVVVARVLHAASIALLALTGMAFAGTRGWLAGVVVAMGLLGWEHRLVRGDDLRNLNAVFFTMNGVISITFCVILLAGRIFA